MVAWTASNQTLREIHIVAATLCFKKLKLILPALNELFVEVGFIYGILWLYETYMLSMVMLLFAFCCYILYNETTTPSYALLTTYHPIGLWGDY